MSRNLRRSSALECSHARFLLESGDNFARLGISRSALHQSALAKHLQLRSQLPACWRSPGTAQLLAIPNDGYNYERDGDDPKHGLANWAFGFCGHPRMLPQVCSPGKRIAPGPTEICGLIGSRPPTRSKAD